MARINATNPQLAIIMKATSSAGFSSKHLKNDLRNRIAIVASAILWMGVRRDEAFAVEA